MCAGLDPVRLGRDGATEDAYSHKRGTKLNLLNRTLKAAIAPCDTWVSCRRAASAREMTPPPPSRRSEVEGRIAMTKSVTKSALSLITFGAVLALLQGTPAQAL